MHKHGWLGIVVLASVVGGCAPEEPSWEEGEIGEIYEGLSVGGAGGCSTFVVDGLSKQLIAEQNCIRANALVSFAGKKGLSHRLQRLSVPRAESGDGARGGGRVVDDLSVTSAFRTIAQQYLLYRWYQTGQCGISLAAVPGNSNHETGIAVDVSNYSAEIGNMSNHGWTHTLSVVRSGALRLHRGRHDRPALGERAGVPEAVEPEQPRRQDRRGRRLRADDGVEDRRVAGDGIRQGLDLRAEDDAAAAPNTTEWAATLVGQSMPDTLGAGEMQAAWVEFKNTGTATWEPGVTNLGTTDPRDRDSVLSAPDWLSANRAATVDATTKPGETGRFTFSLRGPVVSSAEALTEHFGLVQEGVAWFPASASLTVDVTVMPAAVPGADPQDSTEGGATPTPADSTGGAHGGCSVGGHGERRRRRVSLLLVIALTLFARRRASYSLGRCRASVDSSSFSSSRSR